MQALLDALAASAVFLAVVAVAVLVALGVSVHARRNPMDDAARAETFAAAQPPARPVVVVDVSDEEVPSFGAVLALLAAHRDDIDSEPYPDMPKFEALLRARRVRAS
jgi:hypothetical protein